MLGARVLSFRKRGGAEVLWSPRTWRLDAGEKWAHGGIPPCWPWFGSSGPANSPMHGFASKSEFEVRGRSSSPERAELVLGLGVKAGDCAIWPHAADLEIRFVLTDKLHLEMKTVNKGEDSFMLTCGFHPDFAIGDRAAAWVTGTDGMKFCDSRVTRDFDGEWRGCMKLKSSFDHVFVEPILRAFHALVDPATGRRICERSSGASRLVVWNPGVEEPASRFPEPGELEIGDWQRMVCVEPAILWKDAQIELKPGGEHVLVAEISEEK